MPSSSKSNIYFFFDGVRLSLKNRVQLKKFIQSIFRREKKKLVSLCFIFCKDQKLLDLNRKFLFHNYYTDILTFALSESKNEVAAEIYISIDRVRENAAKFKKSFANELHRIIFHGVLHLCGYNDETPPEIKKIRNKEDYYLKKYRS